MNSIICSLITIKDKSLLKLKMFPLLSSDFDSTLTTIKKFNSQFINFTIYFYSNQSSPSKFSAKVWQFYKPEQCSTFHSLHLYSFNKLSNDVRSFNIFFFIFYWYTRRMYRKTLIERNWITIRRHSRIKISRIRRYLNINLPFLMEIILPRKFSEIFPLKIFPRNDGASWFWQVRSSLSANLLRRSPDWGSEKFVNSKSFIP